MRVHRLLLPLLLFTATLNAQEWCASFDEGNTRFRSGSITYTDLTKLREGQRPPRGQHPQVTVLACADSRVPPELIYGQTLGCLFIVRVAGNVADTFDLASIEYAVIKGYTKEIIVLAHEDCGAVSTAMAVGPGPSPALAELIGRIRYGLPPTSDLKTATKQNAKNSVQYLLAHSDIIRKAVERPVDPVKISAAYYSMASGMVEPVR